MIQIEGYEQIERFNADQITKPWDLITYRSDKPIENAIVHAWKKYFKSKGHPFVILKQGKKEIMMVEYTADDMPEPTLYELPLFMQRLSIKLPE